MRHLLIALTALLVLATSASARPAGTPQARTADDDKYCLTLQMGSTYNDKCGNGAPSLPLMAVPRIALPGNQAYLRKKLGQGGLGAADSDDLLRRFQQLHDAPSLDAAQSQLRTWALATGKTKKGRRRDTKRYGNAKVNTCLILGSITAGLGFLENVIAEGEMPKKRKVLATFVAGCLAPVAKPIIRYAKKKRINVIDGV